MTAYNATDFDPPASVAYVTLRGQFLLIEQSWGILGRNVLNNVSLLFDGPTLVWQEHKRN